ncbi:MAG: hypothetical protein KGZ39_06110 [Simkania sp.]|nr:hypothetical protein [Simkania sp.]
MSAVIHRTHSVLTPQVPVQASSRLPHIYGRLEMDARRIATVVNSLGGVIILALGIALLFGAVSSIPAAIVIGLSIYFVIQFIRILNDRPHPNSYVINHRHPPVMPRYPQPYPTGPVNPHATFGSRTASGYRAPLPPYDPPRGSGASSHGTFGARNTSRSSYDAFHRPTLPGHHTTFGSRKIY